MKQTAVDWLQEALEDTILTHEQIMQTIGLFEQAKAMEKEQIIFAQMDMFNHINQNKFGLDYLNKRDAAEEYAEQYYNETVKSE